MPAAKKAVEPKPKPATASRKAAAPKEAPAPQEAAPTKELQTSLPVVIKGKNGPVIIGGKTYYKGETVTVGWSMAVKADGQYPKDLLFRIEPRGKWLREMPRVG